MILFYHRKQKGSDQMHMAEAKLQETKKHGSTLFPFNIYPCTIPGDFPSVPLHWQKSAEIIYVKKGSGQVQIEMDMLQVAEGDIIVLPPGTLHALRELPGNVMEYENIIFDVEFLGGGAADVCAKEFLVPFAAGRLLLAGIVRVEEPGYEKLSACLKEAEELCETRERGYELGVKAAMLRFLFLLLYVRPEVPKPDSDNTERLKKVVAIVDREYMNSLSVEHMAKECGCSSSHFMRWFKKMTGMSFGIYLSEKRLAAAAELLRQTDEKIVNIAENVGYENLSNFNRQFKSRYGMTPRQYRGC